jgi:hypothetical protein
LKKKTFYFWASDIRNNSGEGVLANQFLSDIKRYNKSTILVNINNNNKKYHTFGHKYFLNFFGALRLWKYYCRGYQTIYINYLPIWNFIVFLILPPKTILGPITGSLIYNKQSLLDSIRRGFLLNIFKNISLFIIFLRQKKILFSTELLKSSIKKNKIKRCYFNYVLKIFPGFSKKKNKKNIDFLIYNRRHKNKNNAFVEYFIKNTFNKKYKIIVVGDPINLKNIDNVGYISRERIKSLLVNTKCTFGSSENLYTLFILDAISSDVLVFYEKKLKIFHTKIKYNKMLAIDFKNNINSLKHIISKLDRYNKFNNKNYFKIKNYENFFKKLF